jgi:hypothetical protein
MTRQPLTGATITPKQIKALRDEAIAAGDYRQADWCDVALASHERTDSEGNTLFAPSGVQTTRSKAREVCADVINYAAGQEDSGTSSKKTTPHASKKASYGGRAGYWNIDDGHGNQLAAGLSPEILARRIAQEKADERGESVWMYDPRDIDDEGEVRSEEIRPKVSKKNPTQLRREIAAVLGTRRYS